MTIQEFSNEFDVLYNNIMSNQAPGIDEYEKSVFLTKAQSEIIKNYFSPMGNKHQQGFDDSEKRQIDFSQLMRVAQITSSNTIGYSDYTIASGDAAAWSFKKADGTSVLLSTAITTATVQTVTAETLYKDATNILRPQNGSVFSGYKDSNGAFHILNCILTTNAVNDLGFDSRGITVSTPPDVLMFINEFATVTRNSVSKELMVVPIKYTEYARLMSKPYRRPLKNQAWRLLNDGINGLRANLIFGVGDTFNSYTIRYLKRPQAIILAALDNGVTLDNITTSQECELDPILHPEILQRAVELAKSAYTGDLKSSVDLGQRNE